MPIDFLVEVWYTIYSERGKQPAPQIYFNEVSIMKKLNNHPYAQCGVVNHEDGAISFISYATTVIRMTFINGIRHMECTGTYSATTRKQIGYFLKEYAPDLCYHDMKRIIGMGAVAM